MPSGSAKQIAQPADLERGYGMLLSAHHSSVALNDVLFNLLGFDSSLAH